MLSKNKYCFRVATILVILTILQWVITYMEAYQEATPLNQFYFTTSFPRSIWFEMLLMLLFPYVILMDYHKAVSSGYLAVSLLSIVVAYICMIGFVARQTYEAILLLSFFWIGFSIGMFLVFAGTVLLILRCPVYAFIKNRSFTRRFMNLNYLYGILALLVLMPLCITAWKQMQLNLPTFQALLRQRDMLDSYVYAFDYQDGFRFDGYDEQSIEEDYRNKKPIKNEM